jgi:hypothetical protein
VFLALENSICTLKWPGLKAKIGKMKKSKFGRIDSWFQVMPNKGFELFSSGHEREVKLNYNFSVASRFGLGF